VTESAWQNGSPVVEIIKNIIKSQEGNSGVSLTDHDSTLQPYNMFFKRLLQLAAQRVLELGQAIGLD
jgi:hypothetical protein